MNLSKEAITKLRVILEKQIGAKANELSDEVITSYGTRLLKVTAICLKSSRVQNWQSGRANPEHHLLDAN